MLDEESTTDGGTMDSMSEVSPGGLEIEFGASTGGLDFMSSNGYPEIEFGYDDATDEEDTESDEEDESQSTNAPHANGGDKMANLVSHLNLISRSTEIVAHNWQ